MNEWAKLNGRADDREVIDLMLAHVPGNKVEGAYNRAACLPRRRKQTLVGEACKSGEPWLRRTKNPSATVIDEGWLRLAS